MTSASLGCSGDASRAAHGTVVLARQLAMAALAAHDLRMDEPPFPAGRRHA
jgi:hypothetical protein